MPPPAAADEDEVEGEVFRLLKKLFIFRVIVTFVDDSGADKQKMNNLMRMIFKS